MNRLLSTVASLCVALSTMPAAAADRAPVAATDSHQIGDIVCVGRGKAARPAFVLTREMPSGRAGYSAIMVRYPNAGHGAFFVQFPSGQRPAPCPGLTLKGAWLELVVHVSDQMIELYRDPDCTTDSECEVSAHNRGLSMRRLYELPQSYDETFPMVGCESVINDPAKDREHFGRCLYREARNIAVRVITETDEPNAVTARR